MQAPGTSHADVRRRWVVPGRVGESARKKAAKEVATLEAQERVARDLGQGAQERRLREELQTWRDVLEKDPEHGRAALRQMLHGPIQAKYFPETDSWNFYGMATFGGVLHRILGVSLTQAELDDYNAYSDYLNAELAAGRDPFDEVPPTGEELKRYGRAMRGGSASHAGSTGSTPTSDVQMPSCPRGDSNATTQIGAAGLAWVA